MNTLRNKKLLGLALGERSLVIAEVAGGERLSVLRTAEMPYPPEATPAQPQKLGDALASFLKSEGFSARSAIIGLPARWLVTQPKEVPHADKKTVTDMLRLGAEAEFSTELKDLVYDFTGSGTSVLLVATPRKYVDAALAMCQAAKLTAEVVTATALALGEVTSRAASNRDVLVLSVASGGAEMTMQRNSASGALRHLRAPEPAAPFINELRRTVSTLPASKADRQLILWDGTGLDAKALSEQIGVPIRSADLPLLGVSPSANGNGQNASQNGGNATGKYASAIALGIAALSEEAMPVDFLHSRLAPPKQRLVPRWAVIAGTAVVLFIAGTVWAFHDLNNQAAQVDKMQTTYDALHDRLAAADAFVSKVSFAQGWHGGDPRYLSCVRDLTLAMQDDFDTFAISLIIGEAPRLPNAKTPDTHALVGVLQGKAADQPRVLALLNRISKMRGFTEATLGGSDVGRARQVTFSINFKYQLQSVGGR